MAERVLKVTVLSDFRRYQRDQKELENGLTRFAKRTQDASGQLQGFGTLLLTGSVALGLKAAKDAGTDLQTQNNRVGASFGTAAGDIRSFAKTADTSLGLSERAALSAAAGFGLTADAVDFTDQQAAAFSKDMVNLAGVMAKATGKAPAEAIEGLGDAFRGEFDTLDNFGIKLSAGAVQQELLRMGADKLTGRQREQAEVQATVNLLHERSAPLVAQAAANTDSQADKQAKLNAQWDNAKAALGERLLPLMSDATEQGTKLLTAFTNLDERTGGMASKLTLGAGAVAGLGFVAAKVVGQLLTTRKAWLAYKAEKLLQIPVNATVAASEEALAAKTALSGNAAATAGTKWSGLAGTLSKIGIAGAALGVVAVSFDKLKTSLQEAATENERYGRTAVVGGKGGQYFAERVTALDGKIRDHATAVQRLQWEQKIAAMAARDLADASSSAGAKTAEATAAAQAAEPVTVQLGSATLNLGTSTATAADKLKTYREVVAQVTEKVGGAIPVFEGYKAAKDVTARSVLTSLEQERDAYRTWADDVQRLLKRGADPKFVQELSEKGPAFVHAMAIGSDKQLALAERFFAQRTGAMQRVAQQELNTTGEHFKKLQREANAALRGIHDEQVRITAAPAFRFSTTFTQKDWLTARQEAGRAAKGMLVTQGTTPTADDVLVRVSKGETVVSAAHSARPEFQAWAGAVGIPGFQGGGTPLTPHGRVGAWPPQVSQFPARGIASIMGDWTGGILDAALRKLFTGRPGILRFIRAADDNPYIWGGVGPGGWDCSGLTGSVYALHKRLPPYRRYFTTASNFAAVGFSPGPGGVYQIGVDRAAGHMAGRYGGLAFEARNSRTGIVVGSGARSVFSFPAVYHMARGGRIGNGFVSWAELLAEQGLAVGGDPAKLRIDTFDAGGWLQPGTTLAVNRTGRPERVGDSGEMHLHLHFHGPILGSARQVARELVPEIRSGLREAQRRDGIPAHSQIR